MWNAEPWIAEVFNSIPWVMTGVLMWICIYFIDGAAHSSVGRGSPLPRAVNSQALILSSAATVATLTRIYFWDAR